MKYFHTYAWFRDHISDAGLMLPSRPSYNSQSGLQEEMRWCDTYLKTVLLYHYVCTDRKQQPNYFINDLLLFLLWTFTIQMWWFWWSCYTASTWTMTENSKSREPCRMQFRVVPTRTSPPLPWFRALTGPYSSGTWPIVKQNITSNGNIKLNSINAQVLKW